MNEPKSYIGFKAWGFGFDAHLTLIYTGDLAPEQEKTINELVAKVSKPSFYSVATRAEITMFGPLQNIPVLKINVMDELHALRAWFLDTGEVPNPSEFAWNPHVTLEYTENQPLVIPAFIRLTHLGLY